MSCLVTAIIGNHDDGCRNGSQAAASTHGSVCTCSASCACVSVYSMLRWLAHVRVVDGLIFECALVTLSSGIVCELQELPSAAEAAHLKACSSTSAEQW